MPSIPSAPVTVSMESLLLSLMIAIILTVGLPALGWYIKRLIVSKDDAAIKSLKQWQDGAVERHEALKKTVEKIEQNTDAIKTEVANKVDREECERWSMEKWDRLNNHEHLVLCKRPDCHVQRTSGVIVSSRQQGG